MSILLLFLGIAESEFAPPRCVLAIGGAKGASDRSTTVFFEALPLPLAKWPERGEGVMGWTPPDGLGVPEWWC